MKRARTIVSIPPEQRATVNKILDGINNWVFDELKIYNAIEIYSLWIEYCEEKCINPDIDNAGDDFIFWLRR